MNEIIITDGTLRQRCVGTQDVTTISVERTAL